MGNRFSSIAVANKVAADRRPGSGPIRTARSSEHRTLPYPKQSPKRAELERRGSTPSHARPSRASSSSSSARLTRFRADSPDTESSTSDIEEGPCRPAYQGSDNAAHDERNPSAAPSSCVSTLSAPTRDSGAPSPTAHRYTAFLHMPTESPLLCIPLDLRPIPSLPAHFTSTHTLVHVQVKAQTTSLPLHVSRESSPDYELLNPNTQGQAVAELEEPGAVAPEEVDAARCEPSADPTARPGSEQRSYSDTRRAAGRASGAVSRVRDVNDSWTIPSVTTGPPKIPKPAGVAGRPGRGGYTLQKALKLDDTRYCAIRSKMNKLVEAHLEPVTFKKQSQERVAAYVKEAVKILPVLDEYEGNWPALDFAAAHLHYWRVKLKRAEYERARLMVESGEFELESEGEVAESRLDP